jgi:multidrug transporter EmrE-like cation transporter
MAEPITEPKKDAETITLTKDEYASRMTTMGMVGTGIGISFIGFGLLLDRKIDKSTAYGIGIAGLAVIGITLLFRKIDTISK